MSYSNYIIKSLVIFVGMCVSIYSHYEILLSSKGSFTVVIWLKTKNNKWFSQIFVVILSVLGCWEIVDKYYVHTLKVYFTVFELLYIWLKIYLNYDCMLLYVFQQVIFTPHIIFANYFHSTCHCVNECMSFHFSKTVCFPP